MAIPRAMLSLDSNHFSATGRNLALKSNGVFDFTSATVTFASPSANNHPATKGYADALASGLTKFKDAVIAFALRSGLPPYTQAGDGVGATLTANSNGAFPAQDGVSSLVNQRYLVADDAVGAHADHGIYVLSQVGDGSNPWILIRATDADADQEVGPGMYVFVDQGTNYADTAWVISTNGSITVDTTAVAFSKFSRVEQITGGNGITRNGLQISVNLAADPGLEFSSNALRAKINSSGGLERTSNGLGILLNGVTLNLSANGIKVADLGIGSVQIAANAVTPAKRSWSMAREYYADSGWSFAGNINSRNVAQASPLTDSNILGEQRLVIDGVELGPGGVGITKRVAGSPAADGEWRLNGNSLEVYHTSDFTSSGISLMVQYPY